MTDVGFSIKVENVQGKPFLHCTVHRWSAGVFKDMLAGLVVLNDTYGTLYAQRMDDKQQRFITMLGFKPAGIQSVGVDNEVREVWVWG